jgi:hypothetical protein
MSNQIKKWENEVTELFQRKKSKWPKTHEEMLNIPGHKGNANQKNCCWATVTHT